MSPPRKPLPFDPAWIALGFAAAVLLGAVVWLMALRAPPAPTAQVAPAPQAAAPAPDPVATRLAEQERRLAELSARPAGDPALAEQLAALTRRDAETQAALAELRAATGAVLRQAGEAVAGRFQELDQGIRAALGEAERRLSAVEGVVGQLPAALGALEQGTAQRLAALERESQSRLEAARAEAAQALAALREEEARRDAETRRTAEQAARDLSTRAAAEAQQALTTLRGEAAQARQGAEAALAALREEANRRLAALETRLQQSEGRNQRLVAAGRIRALLDAGRPLRPALGDNPAPELARFADRAPPTEAALRAAFEDTVRNARAAATPADALARLSSVLTIRRGEEVVFGDAAEAVIERARRALEAGELDAALAQVAQLPEGTRNALRPWTEEAQALSAARAALARLGEG